MKLRFLQGFPMWKYLNLLAVIMISGTAAFGQDIMNITGTVTSTEDGRPLSGVSVGVKNSTNGTVTDASGVFRIKASSGAVLVFSYIGFQKKEVVVDAAKLEVQLSPGIKKLDEAVVIGYGAVREQNLTGSVSEIKSDAINEHAVKTLGEALAGQLAGVQAQMSSGVPGAELTIKIRGIHTISASNAPLYVIDGIPQSDMRNINPADIASITVLKDASSAAIYGARGANGVVLITTKEGKVGRPSFNFNMSYGVQKVDKIIKMMNREQYIAFNIWGKNEAYLREGGSMSDPMSMRPAKLRIPESWANPDTLPNINWQKEVYRIAPIQQYNLSASGGGDVGTYYLSGSYMKQEGTMTGTNYNRTTLRLKTTINVGQRLKLGMNLAPSFSLRNNQSDNGVGSVAHIAVNLPRIVSLHSQTQEWGYTPGVFVGGFFNPLERLKETTDRIKNNGIYSNVWGELSITNSLKFRSQFSYDYNSSRHTMFINANTNGGPPYYGSETDRDGVGISLQNTLSYTPDITSIFETNILLGQSIESNEDNYVMTAASGYPNDLVQTLNVASTPRTATTSESASNLASFFGRLRLNAKDKYLLTVNVRRDGSSRFGRDTKWGWFPSASVGWKIDREDFMKDAEWIDLLKLRLSAGKTGNNGIGDYESIAGLGVTNYNVNGAIVSGLAPSSIGNPDLGWETMVSKNIGLDFSAFNNRIQASLDYYVDDTKDMLLNVPVTFMSGFSSMRRNIGAMRNKGWELELTSHNIQGRFGWTTSFNISRNVNEVTSLGRENTPIIINTNHYAAWITKVGKPIGSYYMYKTDGILTKADFDVNGKAIVPILAGQEEGNRRIVDVNGDGKIDANDHTIVGNNMPDFIWGLTNRVTYKNFDLDILLQGSQGGKVFFLGARHMDVGQIQGMNQFPRWVRSYKPTSPPGEDPFPKNMDVDLSWDGKTPNRFGNNGLFNDTWLYDASFIRIKNISVGYNLPKRVGKNIGIESARIYLMSGNFYTWTNYKGATPEANNSYGNETTQPGVDYGTYPLARTYSVGINLTF